MVRWHEFPGVFSASRNEAILTARAFSNQVEPRKEFWCSPEVIGKGKLFAEVSRPCPFEIQNIGIRLQLPLQLSKLPSEAASTAIVHRQLDARANKYSYNSC